MTFADFIKLVFPPPQKLAAAFNFPDGIYRIKNGKIARLELTDAGREFFGRAFAAETARNSAEHGGAELVKPLSSSAPPNLSDDDPHGTMGR
jgi:hypothetical protein